MIHMILVGSHVCHKLSLMYQLLGSTKHKAVNLEVLLEASQNAKSKVLYCSAVK